MPDDVLRDDRFNVMLRVLDAAVRRLARVLRRHPRHASWHESYGVLAEEMHELLTEIHANRDPETEAFDVAVAALAAVYAARERREKG